MNEAPKESTKGRKHQERIWSDLRHDFLHRASTDLIKNHDSLVLEDLNRSGMVRNRSLARSIADNGWAIFAKDLTYEAQWWGRTVTLADRFYPSTKRCSRCGQVAEAMPLSQRELVCALCGFHADRDVNAACNLAAWPRIVAGKGQAAGDAKRLWREERWRRRPTAVAWNCSL